MSKTEKLILKMKQQPNGIRFDEIAILLKNYGYEMKKTTRYFSQAFYQFKWRCNNH